MDRRTFLTSGLATAGAIGLGAVTTGDALAETHPRLLNAANLKNPLRVLAHENHDMGLILPNRHGQVNLGGIKGIDTLDLREQSRQFSDGPPPACVADFKPLEDMPGLLDDMPDIFRQGFVSMQQLLGVSKEAASMDFEVGHLEGGTQHGSPGIIHSGSLGYGSELRAAPAIRPTDVNAGMFIGDYYVRVSYHYHYVGGCIQRNTQHAGLMVNTKDGRGVFNLHAVGYWSSWRPCIAVYESYSKWCRNTCTYNLWNALWGILYAILTWYIVSWLASAIASAVTGAMLALVVI